jgi:hypothetical protein
MVNASLLFQENINGKLCTETITFPMVFKIPSNSKDKLYIGRCYDFYSRQENTDNNGIKSFSEKIKLFTAQVWDRQEDLLNCIPAHILFLHWGKPHLEVVEILCKRLNIEPETKVVIAFFTKDLSIIHPFI